MRWSDQLSCKSGARQGVLPLAALLCLLLLALLTVVQIAHLHPLDQDPDHCPICIVMHSAAPVAAAAAVVVLVQIGMQASVYAPVYATRRRLTRLFIRPPPSDF
jgi:hypothetical protein